MAREKGLWDMLEAMNLLVSWGEDVVLNLVGWPERGDPILDEMLSAANRTGLSEQVVYHGSKPIGTELFEFYKKSDIYLIASRTSEGFPRTIWEALAHSLPVVATRVGSIPIFLDGAAELVAPQDSMGLALAIKNLLHNPPRRQMLIQNGMRLVRENTLEHQASIMSNYLLDWVNLNRAAKVVKF
jgi:glycosyltransferase involved in cell wall biosynthesis